MSSNYAYQLHRRILRNANKILIIIQQNQQPTMPQYDLTILRTHLLADTQLLDGP